MSGNEGAAPTSTSRYPGRRRGVVAWGTVLLVAAAAIVYWQGRPERLYQQASELQTTDPLGALRRLDESIQAAGGDFAKAQLLRCRLLASLNQWQTVLGEFRGIQDPSRCDAHQLLGLAQQARDARVLVLANLAADAVLRANPKHEAALRLAIPLKYSLGLHDETLELSRRLMTVAPDDPLPWLTAARIHRQQKDIAPAIHAYRQALERNPAPNDTATARYQIASLSIHLGDLDVARRQLRHLLDQDDPPWEVRFLQASLLRREDQPDAALNVLREILADNPDSVDALRLRGSLLFDKEEYQKAARDLSRAVELNPYDRRAHYKLGQTFQRLQQPENAKRHLEESRRLTSIASEIHALERDAPHEPDNRALKRRLAELHQKLGQFDRAEFWRRAAEGRP